MAEEKQPVVNPDNHKDEEGITGQIDVITQAFLQSGRQLTITERRLIFKDGKLVEICRMVPTKFYEIK